MRRGKVPEPPNVSSGGAVLEHPSNPSATAAPSETVPPMPAGCRLIHWEPVLPPVQVSPSEVVLGTEGFIATTLVQLDHCLKGRTWLAGNWGLSGLVARLRAVGCIVEIDDTNVPKTAPESPKDRWGCTTK